MALEVDAALDCGRRSGVGSVRGSTAAGGTMGMSNKFRRFFAARDLALDDLTPPAAGSAICCTVRG